MIPQPVTGELITDSTPHERRIDILAGRYERGEELFHSSELQLYNASKQGFRQFLEKAGGRGRILANTSHRPSDRIF